MRFGKGAQICCWNFAVLLDMFPTVGAVFSSAGDSPTEPAVRRVIVRSSAFVGVIALACAAAPAALITQVPPPFAAKGTLASNGLSLLALQDRGPTGDGLETGSVVWDGAGSVRSGEAKNESTTRSAAALAGIGVDAESFAIVFNANQSAPDKLLDMPAFTLRFAKADGETLFDATYTAAPGEKQRDSKSDYVFKVDLTPQEAEMFFAGGDNRVGMLVTDPISNVSSGGPDRFFVASTTPVPEPATVSVIALAAGAAMLRRSRR